MGRGGGGGKNDSARVKLFSAFEVVCRVDPSELGNTRAGILEWPLSVGGSVAYLLAVQRSRSAALSSQFSQCSFLVDSMSFAYSLEIA